jgi:hypothetical protein
MAQQDIIETRDISHYFEVNVSRWDLERVKKALISHPCFLFDFEDSNQWGVRGKATVRFDTTVRMDDYKYKIHESRMVLWAAGCRNIVHQRIVYR